MCKIKQIRIHAVHNVLKTVLHWMRIKYMVNKIKLIRYIDNKNLVDKLYIQKVK